METEVLIVGAGPVGLAMACELTRYGVAVRIVEKASARTDKSKALVVWSRTLELLGRMGLSQRFIAAGQKAIAANIVAGDKPVGRITFESVASPYPFGLMLPQSETERLLEEHLRELGVRVERNVELLEFTDSGDGLASKIRHVDGSEENLKTAWLIGCDGAHSTVRHQLGMQFEGDTLPSDWVLADVHLSHAPMPGEIFLGWHADGIIALFPIHEDRYRMIADVGQGDPHRLDPKLEEIQAILDRRGPGGIVASSPIWLAAFHINERKVKDYRAGRVFLAGDAAHVHSPAGGQGMNTGIQDACNLAWKLALVCRGLGAPEPLLSSYSAERSAVGEQVLKGASEMTKLAILRGGTKQSIRNHVAGLVLGLSMVRHKIADTLTEVSIGYPESPLNGRNDSVHGGPRAGDRAPIREREAAVGAGNSPRFVLFADGGEATEGLLLRYSSLLEPALRAPFSDGGIWLVRPDGYVAVATKSGHWEAVEGFLRVIAVSAESSSARQG